MGGSSSTSRRRSTSNQSRRGRFSRGRHGGDVRVPGPAVHAKAARGAMCRYVVLNEVTDVEGLKGFAGNDGEWSFASEHVPDGSGSSVTLTFHRTNVNDAKKKKGAASGGGAAKGKRPTAGDRRRRAPSERGARSERVVERLKATQSATFKAFNRTLSTRSTSRSRRPPRTPGAFRPRPSPTPAPPPC